MLLRLFPVLFDAEPIEHVFHPSFFAIGAIAMLAEDLYDRCRNGDTFFRLKENAAIAGEIFVPRDSTKLHAKIHSRWHFLAFAHTYREETDIVGISQGTDPSAAVKGDVEFSRKAIHLWVLENVVVHFLRQRPRVIDFLWVDTRRR